MDNKEKWYKKLDETLLKIRKHYLILWLLLIPPIGIYISFRHKILPKIINIILLIIFILFSILMIDMQLNPNRVLDNEIEKLVKNYDIGSIRDKQYIGFVSDTLGIYEIITTKGIYDIYFSGKDNHINIEGIKDLNSGDNIFLSEYIPQHYNELSPAIIKLFINENKYYENIKKINTYNDYQFITYKNNKKYRFDIKYYKVIKIFDISNNEPKLLYSAPINIKFTDAFQKAFNKKKNIYKDVYEITEYNVSSTTISYTFTNFCGNQYKIEQDLDGNYQFYANDNNISDEEMKKYWKKYKKEKITRNEILQEINKDVDFELETESN